MEDLTSDDARVINLVRIALASEYHKRGLKREEIIEKVSTTMRKASIFDKVLEFANEYLSDNFGFLLVPLPVVSRPVTMSASNNKSRKAAVIQSNKASSSKTGPPQTFALISTLSTQIRAKFPTTSRDTQRLGFLHAILMIIKLSGNNIEHKHLISALNEIKLAHNENSPLLLKDLDPFLEQLKKEKYILREKKSMMDNESVYSWGPRAVVEFDPHNMAEFIFKVACANKSEQEIEPKFREKAERVLSLNQSLE